MGDPGRHDFLRLETRLSLAGRDPAGAGGAINPPLQRATTLVIEDADDLYGGSRKTYALDGMAVHDALCEALLSIEGGAGAELAPSGLAACALALVAMAKSNGELLVVDSVYGPTRRLCDTLLARMGVKTKYFDPTIATAIETLITENTCGIFLESPGSLTLELQDVPAISSVANRRQIPVAIDNTWSAGVYFKPFDHGVDISIQALTKYQAGHSDVFGGAVLTTSKSWANRVRDARKQLGLFLSPDDAYLILRGIRSMPVRLERHAASALSIAHWLADRPEIATVLHPALASHPQHDLWRRDFLGSSGLFSCVLRPAPVDALKAMLEGFRLFSMGFSWGGYESLIIPCNENVRRTATTWRPKGELIRLSIGLEHPDDLIADLEQGLQRLPR